MISECMEGVSLLICLLFYKLISDNYWPTINVDRRIPHSNNEVKAIRKMGLTQKSR
jgi:hypothetical protein